MVARLTTWSYTMYTPQPESELPSELPSPSLQPTSSLRPSLKALAFLRPNSEKPVSCCHCLLQPQPSSSLHASLEPLSSLLILKPPSSLVQSGSADLPPSQAETANLTSFQPGATEVPPLQLELSNSAFYNPERPSFFSLSLETPCSPVSV